MSEEEQRVGEEGERERLLLVFFGLGSAAAEAAAELLASAHRSFQLRSLYSTALAFSYLCPP